MNVHTRTADLTEARSPTKAGIIDCDIHPSLNSKADLKPFLSERWWKHYDTYGSLVRQPLSTYLPYPRMQPDTARRDAWPPGGGPPASDLAFMREQHLDANNITQGILHPLRIGGYDQRNLDFGAALCGAINDWQLHAWAEPEPRLKASIYVPQDFPEAAAAEIERRASDPHFVQITTASFASEPLGHRRYWPVFAAAQAADIAIGMHIGGYSGQAITAGGWPSFYYEHHYANSPGIESVVTSLVMEGVFERFPRLRIVLVEAGFVWVPSLCWRLDRLWERMRDEVPHLTRPPSEYIRQNIWYTTQPIEEPANPDHLKETIDWLGWDRLLFSTDYPHWDYDDPNYAFKFKMSAEQREALFRGNAAKVYRLAQE
jgi:uncharacterized protein